MSLIDQVRNAGVVGAGGGGFPTHVKLAAQADTVIANGAECEPLLHKDAVVMEHQAAQVVAGVQLTMAAVGAKNGIIGIKAKNHEAIKAIEAACAGTPIRIHCLGDFYPAGDEYVLVYEATGRLIPPAGIPLQVGVVVNNVETLVNVAAAAEGKPVIQKAITLAGAVRRPVSLILPIGTSFHDAISAAGGLTTDDPVLCLGGLMMGQTTDNLQTPITKTTTGAVILPRSHPVIQRKLKPALAQARIGKSACDQCRYCTELCPRYLLGYAVEPHQVMRSLGFTATGAAFWNPWANLCCACGLCTLYACPESLFPKEACDQAKVELRKAGVKWTGPAPVKPHPLQEGRRVPIRSLMKKLQIEEYNVAAPLQKGVTPRKLTLPLKQGAGVASRPLVKPGERVKLGQLIAEIPAGALGSTLHAPSAGTVAEVTDQIVIVRDL